MSGYAFKAGGFVGVISDTHGLVRPEALAALAGSELIIHGGDVGGPDRGGQGGVSPVGV